MRSGILLSAIRFSGSSRLNSRNLQVDIVLDLDSTVADLKHLIKNVEAEFVFRILVQSMTLQKSYDPQYPKSLSQQGIVFGHVYFTVLETLETENPFFWGSPLTGHVSPSDRQAGHRFTSNYLSSRSYLSQYLRERKRSPICQSNQTQGTRITESMQDCLTQDIVANNRNQTVKVAHLYDAIIK